MTHANGAGLMFLSRILLRAIRYLQEDGRYLQLQFQFRFTRDLEEVFFAFCFPHSYEDCQKDLEVLEDQVHAVVHIDT